MFVSGFLFSQENSQHLDLSLNLNSTYYKNEFYFKNSKDFQKVSYAFGIGLELLNKKYNTSIEARRTYWYSLSAGNPNSVLNGYSTFSQIGLNYYLQLKNKTKIIFGIAHQWNNEWNYNNPKFAFSYDFYMIKAISPSVGINLTNKFFFEIRNNIYYHSKIDAISLGTNFNRIHFSFIYKINPLKK